MTEDPFVAHRSLLFTVAYELLGSAADAEDVCRSPGCGGLDADQSQVRDPRAYLIQVVTRQALNFLRTVSRRREQYVGEWLPEPLLTSPDVAEDVELADSVSIAMLTVLETLRADGRAVFVFREVFELPYGEIAEVIGKSAVTVRQTAGLIEIDGELAATSLVVENGRITRIYVMRNPRKLTRLIQQAGLAR